MVSASVESGPEYDGQSNSWKEYRIEFAEMPNGGKVTFYNSDKALELGRIVTMYDDNGRYWGIELTNRAVRK